MKRINTLNPFLLAAIALSSALFFSFIDSNGVNLSSVYTDFDTASYLADWNKTNPKLHITKDIGLKEINLSTNLSNTYPVSNPFSGLPIDFLNDDIGWVDYTFSTNAVRSDLANTSLAPHLLVDISLTNVTPGASEQFCYRIRYRCASVTEHCYGAYIEATLPIGVEVPALSGTGGNISSVTSSGTFATGVTVRIDFETSGLGYLEAGSSGAKRICGKWTCDDGNPQNPSAGSMVNLVNPVTFYENSGSVVAANPNDLTVPTFAACPAPPMTSPDLDKYSGEDESNYVQPNGVYKYGIIPTTTSDMSEYIEYVPDQLEVYDFFVDKSSYTDWVVSCDCGSGFVPIYNSGGVNLGFASSNWIQPQIGLGTFPNLLAVDGITDTGCDAVFNADLGFYIISGLEAIKWTTGASGSSSASQRWLIFTKVKDDTPIGTLIQNCAEGTNLITAASWGTDCRDITVVGDLILKDRKYIQASLGTTGVDSGAPAGYTKREDDLQWLLALTFDNNNGSPHTGFSFIDTIPSGLTYVNSGDEPNWWAVSFSPSNFPTELKLENQTGCTNPIFTQETLVDGRTVLKWDFPDCTISSQLSRGSEIYINLYFTTRYDRSAPFSASNILSVSNCAYFDVGVPAYDTETNVYFANGQIKTDPTFDPFLGSSSSFSSTGIVESEKWVKGELDTDFSRYPSFGATNLDGDGVYEIYIWNHTDEGITRLDVADILPHLGDNALVGVGTRDSEWSIELATDIVIEKLDIPSNTWQTVVAGELPLGLMYGSDYNACYLDGASSTTDFVRADPATANFPSSCTDMSTVTAAAGARAFAFRWENVATPLQFGQGLRITVTVQQLNGEADALTGEIAWNSFAYTATQETSGDLLSTEPIKVGLRMVDECTSVSIGDKVWNDVNGNGIQDIGEEGISDVSVRLYESNSDTVFAAAGIPFEMITDSLGNFCFAGLPDGDYIIRLDNPDDAIISGSLRQKMGKVPFGLFKVLFNDG